MDPPRRTRRVPTRPLSTLLLPLIAAALLPSAGCRPIGFAPRLVGLWVGAPETAKQRAARSPDPALQEASSGRSTLEWFDVRVTLDLRRGGAARMWFNDAEGEALRGVWRVASSERDRAVVELAIPKEAAAQEPPMPGGDRPDGVKPAEEKRRFGIQLLEDDEAFSLAEEGADRSFGNLYFRRADAE